MPSSSSSRARRIAGVTLIAAAAAGAAVFGYNHRPGDLPRLPSLPPEPIEGGPSLARFESESAFDDYVARWIERQREEMARYREEAEEAMAAAEAPSPAAAESITNNQVAGIDEGDIVKAAGDYLLVLRRGRVFSMRLEDGRVVPISQVDAFAPGGEQGAGWYDEMLVHGSTILVLGYSYSHSATELGLFDLGPMGNLAHRATYFVRSSDYYSSRDFATRLVGDELVLYTPVPVANERGGEVVPGNVTVSHFQRGELPPLIQASNVYTPIQDEASTLHTIVRCRISDPAMPCTARAVIAPYGRSFYVGRDAVYLHASDVTSDGEQTTGVVYRMPLGDEAPTAVRVRGAPVDALSYHEDGERLHLFLRGGATGSAMWDAERAMGDATLTQIPLETFSAFAPDVAENAYTRLPQIAGYDSHSRFVGEHLLFGSNDQAYGKHYEPLRRAIDPAVYVVSTRDRSIARVPLEHGVSRIEAATGGAVVVGSSGDTLTMSSVALGGEPHRVASLTRGHSAEGDSRTHGFFFKPREDGRGGVFGLPIVSHDGAQIAFVDVEDLAMRELGAVSAHNRNEQDGCIASCTDWYGDARPIFYRGRVFGLLGYELVEAGREGDRMVERGRTSFAPRIQTAMLRNGDGL